MVHPRQRSNHVRRKGLFAFERRWTRLVCDAIAPGGIHADIPEGAGALGADTTLEDVYRASSFLGGIGFRGGLWLIWLLPPLVLGKLTTFGGLDADEREVYLQRLYTHPVYILRQLTFLMKLIACTGYFRNDRVRRAFGVYEEGARDLPLPQTGDTPPREETA